MRLVGRPLRRMGSSPCAIAQGTQPIPSKQSRWTLTPFRKPTRGTGTSSSKGSKQKRIARWLTLPRRPDLPRPPRRQGPTRPPLRQVRPRRARRPRRGLQQVPLQQVRLQAPRAPPQVPQVPPQVLRPEQRARRLALRVRLEPPERLATPAPRV